MGCSPVQMGNVPPTPPSPLHNKILGIDFLIHMCSHTCICGLRKLYICMLIVYVIVKSHYEEVIVVITRVRGGAEDECNNNDNLRVQWDLTGFYPIVFDVRHVTQ